MMTPRVQRFAIILCVLLILVVLDMVRRRKLRERYSLIWLFAVVGMTVLVAWEDLLLYLTSLIGAVNASSTLFLFGILFALLILLHLSNKVSDFSIEIRILAKEVAMLNARASGLLGPGSMGSERGQGGAGEDRRDGSREGRGE